MTNKIEVNWKGQMLFESVAPEGSVLIGAAEEIGGSGKGLRPKAMMLSALAGCTAIDIESLLKKMRAEVADFKIVAEANLTDEHPKYYDKALDRKVWAIYEGAGKEPWDAVIGASLKALEVNDV